MQAWIAGLVMCAGVLVVGALAIRAPSVLGGAPLTSACEDVSQEIAQIQADLPGLNGKLGVLSRRLRMLDTLEDRPDWGVLLAFLHDNRGEGVVLDRCELSWATEGVMTFSLKGLGDTPGRERSVVAGLESSGLFSSTTLLETRREVAGGGERIVFEIECRFDPALAEAPTP